MSDDVHPCTRDRRKVAHVLRFALGDDWIVEEAETSRGIGVIVASTVDFIDTIYCYRDREKGRGWHERTAANLAKKLQDRRLMAIAPVRSALDRMIDKACGRG